MGLHTNQRTCLVRPSIKSILYTSSNKSNASKAEFRCFGVVYVIALLFITNGCRYSLIRERCRKNSTKYRF